MLASIQQYHAVSSQIHLVGSAADHLQQRTDRSPGPRSHLQGFDIEGVKQALIGVPTADIVDKAKTSPVPVGRVVNKLPLPGYGQ